MTTKSRLLLVAGFPSGGTDLMKNILNAHPDVFIGGEVPFLSKLSVEDFGDGNAVLTREKIRELQTKIRSSDIYGRVENPAGVDALLDGGVSPSLEHAIFEMVTDKPSLVRGFKTPQFTEQLETLARLFPSALFLVVIRDIRDVCLSWEKKWGKDKILCSDKWRHRMRAGWEASQNLSESRVLFVSYERILSDTEQVCREVCDFTSLEFSDSMLGHHRFVNPEDGKINYGKAIVKNNFGKWRTKLSRQQIRRIEEVAFDTMKLFGYEPENAISPRPITGYERYRGLLRDVYAMMFVGNRTMSPLNNLRSRLLNLIIEVKKRR